MTRSTPHHASGIHRSHINFTYDAGTNGKGRLTGASDANHSMSWAYDTNGRVTGKSQIAALWPDPWGMAYQWRNDLDGNTVRSNNCLRSLFNPSHHIDRGQRYDDFERRDLRSIRPSANRWTWGDGTAEAPHLGWPSDGDLSTVVMQRRL